MDEQDPSERFRFALLPDSPEARRFIELTHFANADLDPAARALQIASVWHADDADQPVEYLVDFAVVAYCRAFMPSVVRHPLTAHLSIPADLQPLHDTIRSYRNTTVAHSQSELTTTWPVALIDAEQDDRRAVLSTTTVHGLPWGVVVRFRDLVETMLDLLKPLIEEARAALQAHAAAAEPAGTLPEHAGLALADDGSFTARTKRPPYPRGQVTYYSVLPADE